MRHALAMLALLLPLAGGCMAVLGYEPTPEELEAIRRGEDPRANESRAPKPANNAPANSPEQQTPQDTAPSEGIILRWIDAVTVVIEAENLSHVVRIPNQRFATLEAEAAAFRERMDRYTYGTAVRLVYPVKDKLGRPVWRDEEGNLLAEVR
ncbi:MAG: hypothetical protein KJ044_02365 [Planctomycetes bacterium]|nr:hypothetical protein [Planctomycetota bacterium]